MQLRRILQAVDMKKGETERMEEQVREGGRERGRVSCLAEHSPGRGKNIEKPERMKEQVREGGRKSHKHQTYQ